MQFLVLLTSWILSFIFFILLSTYLHELSHYVAAKAVGFQIAGYRFLTIPFVSHGFVDVRIRGQFIYLSLRKALMHGSGLIVHLILIITSVWLIQSSTGLLGKGIWYTALVVNLYLLIINSYPEGSDGRRLFSLIKG